MFKPTSSVRLPTMGTAPEGYAFSMLTDLLGKLGPKADIAELLQGALGWIEAAFATDAATFFLLDHNATSLTEARPFTSSGVTVEAYGAHRLPEDVADDLTEDPRRPLLLGPAGKGMHPLATLFPLSVGAAMRWGAITSLWRRNRIIGAVLIAREGDQELTDGELKTLGQMASCLAALLEQAAAWRDTNTMAARYRTLLHEAPDAMTLYDPSRDRFIEANARAAELFDTPREQLMSTTPDALGAGDLSLALSMAELDLGRPRRVTLNGHDYEVSSSQIDTGHQPIILSVYRRAQPQPQPAARQSSRWTALSRDTSFTERLQESFASQLSESLDNETEYRAQGRDSEERWILCRETGSREATPRTIQFDYMPTPGDPNNPFEDPLTRLTTGALFQNRLEHCLRRARRYKDTEFAVLVMDLDCFNIVNTRFGRDAGDRVLFETARRLESTLRNTDTAARLEGDTFAALLENRTSSEHAIQIARRLLNAVSASFIIGDFEIFLSASIGIATSEVGYLMSSHIIQDARESMRRAKSRGGGSIEIFNTVVCNTPELLSLDEGELSRVVNS